MCLKGPTEVPSSLKRTPPLVSNPVPASVATSNGRKFIISSNRNLPCWASSQWLSRDPGGAGTAAFLPGGKLEGNGVGVTNRRQD